MAGKAAARKWWVWEGNRGVFGPCDSRDEAIALCRQRQNDARKAHAAGWMAALNIPVYFQLTRMPELGTKRAQRESVHLPVEASNG